MEKYRPSLTRKRITNLFKFKMSRLTIKMRSNQYLYALLSIFVLTGCIEKTENLAKLNSQNIDIDSLTSSQPLPPFDNPKTISRRYFVTTSGNDNHDGQTEARAFKTIQRGVDVLKPGDRLYVKAGFYGKQRFKISQSGTLDKPILIEGYRNRPGDEPKFFNFNNHSTLDSSLMPLMDGSERENNDGAIEVYGSYVTIKNFQVTRFRTAVYAYGVTSTHIENIIGFNLGDPFYEGDYSHGFGVFLAGESIRSSVRNCVIVNATAQAFTFSGTSLLGEGNKVYSDDDSNGYMSATDYYFIGTKIYNSVFRNNRIERVGNLGHLGHGFTVKGAGEGNLFEFNTAINLKGGAFVARHRGAKYNTFRNNRAIGGTWGLFVRDGASHNLFENNWVSDMSFGIAFTDTAEDMGYGIGGGYYNTFRRNILNNVSYGIAFKRYGDQWNFSSNYNTFEGTIVDGATYLVLSGHKSKGNVLRNGRLKNVNHFMYEETESLDGELGFEAMNTTCDACGY